MTRIFEADDPEKTEATYGSIILAFKTLYSFPLEVREVMCDQLITQLEAIKKTPPIFNQVL